MPPLRPDSQRAAFAAVLALLVAGLSAAVAYTAWRLHDEAVANNLEIAAMHARSFEDTLTQSLRGTELALASTLAGETEVLPAEVERVFAEKLRHAPHLRSLSLLDPDGLIVNSSNPANLGRRVRLDGFLPPGPADAPYLRLGPPWAGRDVADGSPTNGAQPVEADGLSFLPAIRGFEAGGKRLTLLAAINPDHFINHFDRKLVAAEGSVSVVRFDGTLLLSSDRGARAGSIDAATAAALQGGEVEFGSAAGRLGDGREVLAAFRASRLYPFAVVVRLDQKHALQRWQAETRVLVAVVAVVLVAIVLLGTAWVRRQRQFEIERAESERIARLHSSVFANSNEAIIITDSNAKVIAVNAAFSSITGHAADAAVGRNPRFLSSGRQGREFYAALWREVVERGLWQGELTNRRADGSLYEAALTIIAVRDDAGRLMHYLGIQADITERKRHEAELLAARDQAEAAARAKATFLATMSHELRTPMNAIIGLTQLVAASDIGLKQRGQLRAVLGSAQHLLGLINDVLDFSRLEAGRRELELTGFSPEGLGRQVVGRLAAAASAKRLELKLEPAPGLPASVVGDFAALSKALLQLGDNAIKFTDRGRVVIAIAVESRGEERGTLVCSVSDTGLGISPEQRAQLFSLFEQGDGSATRRHGGTGLGLAIVDRLTRLMRGEIGVRSDPGQGSRFELRVPVDLPDGAVAAPAAAPAAATPAPCRGQEPARPASADAATRTALAELRPLLADGDFAAAARFRECRDRLAVAFSEADLTAIEAHLDAYDHDKALAIVDAGLARMETVE